MANDNGKGDSSRPMFIDEKTYVNNWERTFGKKCKTCKDTRITSDGKWCTKCDELSK
jgi:hypothetical protein